MSFKLPGIGKPILKAAYAIAKVEGTEDVMLTVKYEMSGSNGNKAKVNVFEFKSDANYPTAELMMDAINQCLSQLETKKVTFVVEEEKIYIKVSYGATTGPFTGYMYKM